jgi:hypothetical protein
MLSVPMTLRYPFCHVGKTSISSASHIQPQFCVFALGLRPFLLPAWSPASTRSYFERLALSILSIKAVAVEAKAVEVAVEAWICWTLFVEVGCSSEVIGADKDVTVESWESLVTVTEWHKITFTQIRNVDDAYTPSTLIAVGSQYKID